MNFEIKEVVKMLLKGQVAQMSLASSVYTYNKTITSTRCVMMTVPKYSKNDGFYQLSNYIKERISALIINRYMCRSLHRDVDR